MSWELRWRPEGVEPDYRFTLANERTFLAWIRTALALLGGGLILHQFGTRIEPSWLRVALSGGLILMAGLLYASGQPILNVEGWVVLQPT